MAINETKIDDSIDDALLSIYGYSSRRGDRNRKGGGVALYIKDTILDKCSIRKDLSESSLEVCAWKSNLFELLNFLFLLGIVLLMHAWTFFISERRA